MPVISSFLRQPAAASIISLVGVILFYVVFGFPRDALGDLKR